jgi:putative oligomerization/nucleic acid binding protein
VTASWPGQQMTAVVHPRGEAAQIVVGGDRIGAYRLQMGVWHQAKAVGLLFIKRVTSVLPGLPEPAPAASPGPTTADLLRSLADLRDRGFLTEDEFAAEKKEMLG